VTLRDDHVEVIAELDLLLLAQADVTALATGPDDALLAELDRLMIAATEAAAVGAKADLAIVAPAHSEVEARIEGEDRVIADLRDVIGG
jgi:hypothetical protein